MFRQTIAACTGALTLMMGMGAVHGQSGANVGTLTCNVAGGVGFVFGSSKELSCLFTRTDGKAERYSGSISKFGVDIGFTKDAPGSLAGSYGGATASGTVGVGVGANVLLGGSNKQVTLQPVSVEGSKGLNVAAGIGAVDLNYVK